MLASGLIIGVFTFIIDLFEHPAKDTGIFKLKVLFVQPKGGIGVFNGIVIPLLNFLVE